MWQEGGTRKEMRNNHKTSRGINTANLIQVLIQPRVDQDPEQNQRKQPSSTAK